MEGLTASPANQPSLYGWSNHTTLVFYVDRSNRCQGTVALKVGGDGSFASLHQPIRVPGSIHGKNAKLSPVRLLSSTTAMYSLDELVARAAAMSQLVDVGATPPRKNRPTAGELMTRKTRAGGADDVTRFEALSRVIGHWIRQARQGRCSLDEARQAAVEYNTAAIVPPWDASRLEREFDRLLEKDIHRNGRFGAPDLEAPPLSEDAIAAAFVARHAEDTRYCAALGGWMWWCATHWQRDDRNIVREFMRQVCRSIANNADSKSVARRIASDRTVTAALRLAAADPAISSTVGAWDNAPMCLNTAAGLLDLETGEMHGHDPARLLTQVAEASPRGSCPRWLRFLDRVTAGDRELQTYLQRVAGYCLTGSTREQVFFFFHGTGANGKSVFLQTLSAVLGSYAATAAPGTFTASRSDRHLTELAGLRGARLVVAFETESGQSWAEARIKTVTGGEPIRANFMHRDHFEFRPQFKLIVAGNHRPALTSVNEAIRRRLHLVPFPVTIPDEDRDLLLSDRLLEERDGILAWAIEGVPNGSGAALPRPRPLPEPAQATSPTRIPSANGSRNVASPDPAARLRRGRSTPTGSPGPRPRGRRRARRSHLAKRYANAASSLPRSVARAGGSASRRGIHSRSGRQSDEPAASPPPSAA